MLSIVRKRMADFAGNSGTRWVVFIESNTTGTGRLFARAASQCGYRPVLLAETPDRYPYIKEDGLHVLRCDTGSPPTLRQIIETLACEAPVAGIFSSSEYYIETAAALARMLGLPGSDPESLRQCRNKWTQRQVLRRSGLNTPGFRLAISIADALAALQEIPCPVILKPTLGSGSVGVKLCRTPEEVAQHAGILLQRTVNERGLLLAPEFLLEEYVAGEEFSVESLSGKIIGITRKHVSPAPYFVETGHDFPAKLPRVVQDEIGRTVDTALKAMNLTWGPVHIELRLASAGPTIIEINPRLAGGFIPEIVRLAFGVDIIRETLKLVVGEAAGIKAVRQEYASIRFFLPPARGVIREFAGIAEARQVEGISDVQAYRKIGDAVRIENDFRDRIGHVIARSTAQASAAQAAETAHSRIRIVVEPN
jgi:argininosuccinate lyase